MTQDEFNRMLAVAIAKGLPGGYYTSRYSGEEADRILAGAGQEDRDNPGCYYRIVNGVKEWINPPMRLGIEYRTSERWNGRAVYTAFVDCGKFDPPGPVKQLSFANLKCSAIVSSHFSFEEYEVPTTLYGGSHGQNSVIEAVAIAHPTLGVTVLMRTPQRDLSKRQNLYLLVNYVKP